MSLHISFGHLASSSQIRSWSCHRICPRTRSPRSSSKSQSASRTCSRSRGSRRRVMGSKSEWTYLGLSRSPNYSYRPCQFCIRTQIQMPSWFSASSHSWIWFRIRKAWRIRRTFGRTSQTFARFWTSRWGSPNYLVPLLTHKGKHSHFRGLGWILWT